MRMDYPFHRLENDRLGVTLPTSHAEWDKKPPLGGPFLGYIVAGM
jgi:hypothetical protein